MHLCSLIRQFISFAPGILAIVWNTLNINSLCLLWKRTLLVSNF